MSDEIERTQIRELKDLLGPGKSDARQAYLIVVAGAEIGRMHRLALGNTVIGRARNAQMIIEEPGVSRQHVEIVTRDDGSSLIRDCGSTNGSLLNGEALPTGAEKLLQDGDKIQIGTAVLLKFSYQDRMDESFQKHLYTSAVRDALTGAYNKRYLKERLDQEFAYARRHRIPLSLVVFDLDHFKQVNDTRGHACGDFVLKTVAGLILGRMRREEVLARYGGEEFVVVLRETGLEQAVRFAERMREAVASHPMTFGGATFHVTMSVGVAATDKDVNGTVDELFQRADACLYAAKRGGRNQVRYGAP